jgi:hypothetical protein
MSFSPPLADLKDAIPCESRTMSLSPRIQLACSLSLAAMLLLCTSPSEALERVSFTLGDLRIDYLPVVEGQIPLGIELVFASDGSVEAVLPGLRKATDVTLKRGVIGSASPDPDPAAWLDFSYEQRLPVPMVLGRLSVEGLADARIEIEVQDASPLSPVADADAIVLRLDRRDAGDRLVLEFEAAGDDVLTGTPAALFGPSGTGKTLAAEVLAPPRGSEVTLTLRVVNQRGQGTLIPVKVKHNI